MSKAVDDMKKLLDAYFDCPPIEQLKKLPDVTDIQFYIEWIYKKRHHLAFKLFDEKYPDQSETDKWRKIRNGYEIAYYNFVEEFEQKLEELAANRADRLAYIKWTKRTLYSGVSRNEEQQKIVEIFRPTNFDHFKSQIVLDLWDELNVIGHAVWASQVYGRAIDSIFEQRLQDEGEPPIPGGWIEYAQLRKENYGRANKAGVVAPFSNNDELTHKLSDEPPAELKNLFNNMSLKDATNYFMQLATNKNANGNPFLTEAQVKQFIDRGFIGNEAIEKLTFNMADGERTSITKLFYLYYLKCTNDYAVESTKQVKKKYVRLLTDNFTNYKFDTVFSNFNNSKQAPMQWNTTVL